MKSDTEYKQFFSIQERNMKKIRHEGKPETKKQKAATDKIRLAKRKTSPEENKKKRKDLLRKVQEFKDEQNEKKNKREWPHCFDTEFGYLFKNTPQLSRKYEKLLERGYMVSKANKRDASFLASLFQLADAGDLNKKPGNFPRNVGKKEYIFDTQNTSNSKHSKR